MRHELGPSGIPSFPYGPLSSSGATGPFATGAENGFWQRRQIDRASAL